MVQLRFTNERDVRELLKSFCSMAIVDLHVTFLKINPLIDAIAEIAASIKPNLVWVDAYHTVEDLERDLRQTQAARKTWVAHMGTVSHRRYFVIEFHDPASLILLYTQPIDIPDQSAPSDLIAPRLSDKA
jgi:hypothetical protein